MALTKATPNILDGVQWEYNTKDDMLVATRHKVGDYVKTRGYERPGDGGAAIYKIVAAGTGTDDGGSYHDLTGIAGQAQLQHGGHVRAEQFGVVLDVNGNTQERGAEFISAFVFAATQGDNTYTGDDAAASGEITTRGIRFSCHTDFTTNETIFMTRDGTYSGAYCENMKIDLSGDVIVVSGGSLDSHTQERPLPAVCYKLRNCEVIWPRISCEMICAGIKAKGDIGNTHHSLDLRGFSRYGLWRVANNDTTWVDPIIKQFVRDPAWVRNGVDPDNWDNWNGDCVVVSTKDWRMIGGQVGWGGPCVRLLDTYPATDAERIPGQNCYWCGLESGKGYLDGDNGAGDVVFNDLHMMQAVNDSGWTEPRYGAYVDYDLTTGTMVTKTVDSTIGILSFCKIANLSFFDRLDNDEVVHLLFGAQVEITDETPGSQPHPISKSTDTSHILDPRIRIFASKGAAGNNRYPFMASMHHQRQMTVGFMDNPAEIYWNGSALVESPTSWNGDWDEWNRINRASGSYSGQIQWMGRLAAGTYSPSVSAAGDYWIAQGAVTVNPGGVSATDGQIIYALTSSPAGSGDWLVVNADSAPVRETTRFEVEARPHQYIVYPENISSGRDQRYIYTGAGEFSEKWQADGNAVSKKLDATGLHYTSAGEYTFDGPIQPNNGLKIGEMPQVAISSGSVTPEYTGIRVVAETGTIDSITTIDATNAGAGDVLVMCSGNTGETITIENGTGNIKCGANRTLNNIHDTISFVHFNGTWRMIGYSDNA